MYIMAASINTFDSEEDQNWFKASLATRWTREGIQGVIATGAERLHKHILEAVCSTNSIPERTTCDQCSTASLGVLPCPTRGVCKKQKGKCQFHTVPVSACPNKICDSLLEEIKSQHRYRNPSWKNTRAERWCREPFELIKCYLPEDGYLHIENLESTDFNGIVSILINCKWFTSMVKEDMSKDDNVCTKARVVARDLRHNSRFQLDTAQLQDLMTAFLNLLQALAPDPGAQEANDKVTKLQVGGVTISAIDINSLIKDIRESIKGTVEDAIDQSSETRKIKLDEATKRAEEMINRLVDMKRDTQKVTAGAKEEMTAHKEILLKDTQQVTAGAKEEMTAHKEILLKDTQQVTAGAKEEMTAHKEILLKDTQQVTAGAKEEMTAHKEILLKDTQQVTAGAKEEMTAHKEILLKDIECSIHTKETKTCNQKKHEFRQDLITHYRNKKCFAQVSPLNLKHKAPLDNMYVPPKLLYMQKEEGTSCRQSSNGPPVKTYTDLFFKDGRKLQNIYIQGEAGSGKSTFCSHLASVWCRAHSAYNESEPTSSHDCFSDIGVLKRFDFLFLVILRIANETDTDIRALIQNQIAAQLSNENRYTELFVGNILDREVCLVVIDGLDEWPLSTCIPKGIFRLNCTFVTTTRPWKMTEVQLANTDVDAEILIDGVVDSELLISNVLECLKQRQTKPKQTTKERSCENFMEEIRERGLGHLLDVPIVTTQLVCVWFVTGTLGQSRCEVYARTFEMFLKRSQADKERKITATSDSTKLPPCFSEKLTPVCNTNRDFIEHLSKLAFNTLLSEDRNTSIVFDKDIVCEHLSDSECRLALDTGILSEFEVESVIEERSSFNFLHKTFQEFLCAMYIAKHEGDNANSFWEKLTCTYGNVLDMKVIFTFTCGMNKNVGEYLSAHISNAFLLNLLGLPDLFHYHDMMLASFFFFANKNDVRHYQDMMLAGFSECIDNGHAEPNLTFLHSEISAFKRLTAREITYRDQLLDVNAGRLLTLVVDKEDVERVQKEVNRNPGLRNVFMIGDDFQELLYSRSPCCSMDLTKCTSIEILYLHSTNVELPTNLGSTLVECALFSIQTELIQSTILSALGAGAPRLRKLIIRGYHCSCQLLQLLPKLKSLQWLCVSGTVIGDQDLILPRSILNVILNQVNMSERAFKKFVDMLTHMSQEVECFIKFDATEKQVNERCLKYVEENDMCYIQGRTAEESIWFTCPKKKV